MEDGGGRIFQRAGATPEKALLLDPVRVDDEIPAEFLDRKDPKQVSSAGKSRAQVE